MRLFTWSQNYLNSQLWTRTTPGRWLWLRLPAPTLGPGRSRSDWCHTSPGRGRYVGFISSTEPKSLKSIFQISDVVHELLVVKESPAYLFFLLSFWNCHDYLWTAVCKSTPFSLLYSRSYDTVARTPAIACRCPAVCWSTVTGEDSSPSPLNPTASTSDSGPRTSTSPSSL